MILLFLQKPSVLGAWHQCPTYFIFFLGWDSSTSDTGRFPIAFLPRASTGMLFSLLKPPFLLSLWAHKDGTGLRLPSTGLSGTLEFCTVSCWGQLGVLPGPVYVNDWSHWVKLSLEESSSIEGRGGNKGRLLFDCEDTASESVGSPSPMWADIAK